MGSQESPSSLSLYVQYYCYHVFGVAFCLLSTLLWGQGLLVISHSHLLLQILYPCDDSSKLHSKVKVYFVDICSLFVLLLLLWLQSLLLLVTRASRKVLPST